jgi:polyribonucleotide nucleotidyltransferase
LIQTVEGTFGGRTLRLETGRVAKQAGGSCWLQMGDTIALGTATMAEVAREGIDFFPLTCDYEERKYAVGKIPGGFVKRGGRPSEKAILTSRLIDRPLRPLFPYGMRNEVQVIVTPLSVDHDNLPDVLAVVAASAALMTSDIPWNGPVGCVRVGRVEGEFIINPSLAQIEASDLDLIVAGTKDVVNMLEAGASEVGEEDVFAAIEFAHAAIREQCALQEELAAKVGKARREIAYHLLNEEVLAAVRERTGAEIRQAIQNPDKAARESGLSELKDEIVARLAPDFPEQEADLPEAVEKVVKEQVRALILDEKVRPDGRKMDEIRPISCEVGVLPRVHGSGLFTRGQTQVLTALTLGSTEDAQTVDGLEGDTEKRYMHFYNFPPYSVGETRPLRGPGRREIGHGALAERALLAVIPSKDDFPYALLMTSEVLESNGSTSMGATCGSTLALMDGGVPIKAPVSGVAMGLMSRDEEFVILSDIQGMEDFSGDMDFKVAGTAGGITAIQLDTKIRGLTPEIIRQTLAQAKEGRAYILGRMLEAIPQPRAELSKYAPRIFTLQINPEKIGAVIGPGGKMIKQIEAETGASISIEQDGTIFIAAMDGAGGEKAAQMIKGITAEVELGEKYVGKVTRLIGMGAFVEFLPGKEGLVHISHLSEQHIRRPEDVVKVGDELPVRVIEVDSQGRVNLSAVGLDEPFDPSSVRPREERGGGRGGFGGRSGDRDRDRGGRDRGGRGGEPDRGFRGHGASTSGSPAPAHDKDEDETPKARFRPRR